MMQDETKAREVLREITGGEHTLVGRDEAVAAMLAFQSEARAVPPDGEREEGLADRLKVNQILAKHFVPLIDNLGEAIRAGNKACTEILAALSLPHQADREAIARVIDPTSFASWQSLYDYCVDCGDDHETAKRYADDTHLPDMHKSLAKADAILALSPTPSAGRDANECFCPQCGLRHGGQTTADAGF